jgi:uncharacterized protein YbjT (DUF2867 family)
MIHPMRVLVTGATGRVGRAVVGSLTAAGVPVRALTRRPEAAQLRTRPRTRASSSRTRWRCCTPISSG